MQKALSSSSSFFFFFPFPFFFCFYCLEVAATLSTHVITFWKGAYNNGRTERTTRGFPPSNGTFDKRAFPPSRLSLGGGKTPACQPAASKNGEAAFKDTVCAIERTIPKTTMLYVRRCTLASRSYRVVVSYSSKLECGRLDIKPFFCGVNV